MFGVSTSEVKAGSESIVAPNTNRGYEGILAACLAEYRRSVSTWQLSMPSNVPSSSTPSSADNIATMTPFSSSDYPLKHTCPEPPLAIEMTSQVSTSTVLPDHSKPSSIKFLDQMPSNGCDLESSAYELIGRSIGTKNNHRLETADYAEDVETDSLSTHCQGGIKRKTSFIQPVRNCLEHIATTLSTPDNLAKINAWRMDSESCRVIHASPDSDLDLDLVSESSQLADAQRPLSSRSPSRLAESKPPVLSASSLSSLSVHSLAQLNQDQYRLLRARELLQDDTRLWVALNAALSSPLIQPRFMSRRRIVDHLIVGSLHHLVSRCYLPFTHRNSQAQSLV
ncbi:unnamed protein product [Protopolystoma xenopodis]|uniref:Uncharacterized protein n=1 Tax=Protopolystoma xenopodis TaxID=117903 RepID=A0A3S5B9J1_9PLAT|nr:unnamed protein product [Protopolystoma xenopodis]